MYARKVLTRASNNFTTKQFELSFVYSILSGFVCTLNLGISLDYLNYFYLDQPDFNLLVLSVVLLG